MLIIPSGFLDRWLRTVSTWTKITSGGRYSHETSPGSRAAPNARCSKQNFPCTTRGLGRSSSSGTGVLYTKIHGVLGDVSMADFQSCQPNMCGNRPQTFRKSLQLWFSRNTSQHWGLLNEHQITGRITGSSNPQKTY